MKEIDYQAPVIKTLTLEYLMAGGSVTAPGQGIGYGGEEDGEGDAKGDLTIRSVWDD